MVSEELQTLWLELRLEQLSEGTHALVVSAVSNIHHKSLEQLGTQVALHMVDQVGLEVSKHYLPDFLLSLACLIL